MEDLDGLDAVPLRDHAIQAPVAARRGVRVVRASEPVPVRVWCQVGRELVEAEFDGWALGWTDRQVHVRYVDDHGRAGAAWVWASAVSRR